MGKIFSMQEHQNIYTGGLDKSGAHGKYSIFYQDSCFQIVYHVSNLITYESGHKNLSVQNDYLYTLQNIRKKLLGNDYINIIWMENPYQDFDPNIIVSGVILIYIIIYPVSESHYLIRIKHNKRSKFNIMDKVLNYFSDEISVSLENDNLSSYLIKLITLLNLQISYTLQKSAYKKVEIENRTSSANSFHGFQNLQNQILLDTNITQRFKEIERINYRFKNSI
jgi:hypothetical protein